jgi:hypothetical protein
MSPRANRLPPRRAQRPPQSSLAPARFRPPPPSCRQLPSPLRQLPLPRPSRAKSRSGPRLRHCGKSRSRRWLLRPSPRYIRSPLKYPMKRPPGWHPHRPLRRSPSGRKSGFFPPPNPGARPSAGRAPPARPCVPADLPTDRVGMSDPSSGRNPAGRVRSPSGRRDASRAVTSVAATTVGGRSGNARPSLSVPRPRRPRGNRRHRRLAPSVDSLAGSRVCSAAGRRRLPPRTRPSPAAPRATRIGPRDARAATTGSAPAVAAGADADRVSHRAAGTPAPTLLTGGTPVRPDPGRARRSDASARKVAGRSARHRVRRTAVPAAAAIGADADAIGAAITAPRARRAAARSDLVRSRRS